LNNKIPPNLTQSDTTLPNPLKINKYFFCEQIQVKQGRITNVTAYSWKQNKISSNTFLAIITNPL
jgi:hypothetical protein